MFKITNPRYFIAGLITIIMIVLSGFYVVYAVSGNAPNINPADNWGTVSQGLNSGEIITDPLWNGLVNTVGERSMFDFSVAGSQVNITCNSTRQNFRAGTAPGAGVKGAVYNFYKTGSSDARARLYETDGTPLGVIFAGHWEHHSDCGIQAVGDFVIIPVDSSGYFACEGVAGGHGNSNANIQLTLIAYIY
jgi:hypothetical protein